MLAGCSRKHIVPSGARWINSKPKFQLITQRKPPLNFNDKWAVARSEIQPPSKEVDRKAPVVSPSADLAQSQTRSNSSHASRQTSSILPEPMKAKGRAWRGPSLQCQGKLSLDRQVLIEVLLNLFVCDRGLYHTFFVRGCAPERVRRAFGAGRKGLRANQSAADSLFRCCCRSS